jgi:hypothetical protein
LTPLAPDIVEAIPRGRQPAELTLSVLMRLFPGNWQEQGAMMLSLPSPDL